MERSFFSEYQFDNGEREALKGFITQKLDVIPAQIIKKIKSSLSSHRAVLLKLENQEKNYFTTKELHQLNPNLAKCLGELIIQNSEGDTSILVYDRDRQGSMWTGSRYHQTREGGSIHTDNVNVPERWDILYLSCLSPALAGGESILVDGIQIEKVLRSSFPKALKTLTAAFTWEMRGVADKLYEAPIITYDDQGKPHFRHLRPYMESAYQKAEKTLSEEQLYAIDMLDALLNSSALQMRYTMQRGDILLTQDSQVLHGRTCFSDQMGAIPLTHFEEGQSTPLKRTMERLWIKA